MGVGVGWGRRGTGRQRSGGRCRLGPRGPGFGHDSFGLEGRGASASLQSAQPRWLWVPGHALAASGAALGRGRVPGWML